MIFKRFFNAFSARLFRAALGVLVILPAATAAHAAEGGQDAQFASLFSSWVNMDGGSADRPESARSSIPSREPVESMALTSSFGVRSDPFNGRRRMHQGIDIPGPLGTPIYATADGVVERAEWANGYGNLIELNHGNGLQTRYGHLSKMIAQPNERVRRGQLIALMGSTGRSTGSHLHYEVRIAGAAVDPSPYIRSTNYELALREARDAAVGGPEARNRRDNGQ
jgi:murein DD-endopeptidase MepM/ murein hydrolase activator NlpD